MSGEATFEFRVSDSLFAPLRGQLLRLRVSGGRPLTGAIGPGRTLTVQAPSGATRQVRILDQSMTGGRVNQARLDRVRELDIVIAVEEANVDGVPIGLGWLLRGPGA